RVRPANPEVDPGLRAAIRHASATVRRPLRSDMLELFQKARQRRENTKPPYLDRIDELEKVSIVRLQGKITRDMIPVIEARIKANRRAGGKIDKKVILDFGKVEDVDSATVASHIIHLAEFHV